ncbi:MAG: right-handed parallel beta-helix repeat-containing protein [Planctomycetota bacterium]
MYHWKKMCVAAIAAAGSVVAHAERGAEFPDEPVDHELRVDPAGGGDFAAIQPAFDRATELLRQGEAVKVSIAAGVYREQPSIELDIDDPAAEPLLIVEGDPDGGTVVSGSRVEGWEAEHWTPVPGRPGVYRHPWTRGHTMYPGPWANNFGEVFEGVAGRDEAIWIGGRSMTPVALDRYTWVDPDGRAGEEDGAGGIRDRNNRPGSFRYDGLDPARLDVLDRPWTFAVCNHPDAPPAFRDTVFIRVPEDLDLADAGPIEVGEPIQDQWFDGLLVFRRKNNVILRDVTVTHGTGKLVGVSLAFYGCRNVLLERVHAVDNAVAGIQFTHRTRRGEPAIVPSHLTVRDSVASDNGTTGLAGRFTDSLIEDSDFSFNNHRGYAGGWDGFAFGGVKNGKIHRVTYRDCTFVGNAAPGLWFDVFCSEVLYERCFVYGNYGAGIFFELSGNNPEHGDDVARHCVSAYNNDFGFKISNMRRSSVLDCLAVNNRRQQLTLMNHQNRFPRTAEGYEYLRSHDNVIILQRPDGQIMGTANPQLDRGQELLKAYDGQRNRYLMARDAEPPFITAGYQRVDFAGWVADLVEVGAVSAEVDSTFEEVPSIDSQRLDFVRSEPNLLTEWCTQRGVTIPWDLIERFRADPTWTDERMEAFTVGR